MAPPPKKTIEIVNSIIERVACGEPVSKICNGQGKYPDKSNFYIWMHNDKELLQRYMDAKDASGYTDIEKLGDLADDVIEGTIAPGAASVAAHIIKFIAGVKKPKKYGNQIQVDQTIEDKQVPKIEIIEVKKDKDEKEE